MNSINRENCDFSGWATVYGVKCSDGRIIIPGAFKDMNGSVVPLVWQHGHSDVANILGHALIEERPSGSYLYGFFNETESASNARLTLEHGDITALSIYANNLVEQSKRVTHGIIREASLVLAGANPGAVIDYVAFQHDGFISEMDDEAVIYTDKGLDFFDKGDNSMAQSGKKTVADVFNTLSEDQKELFYVMAYNFLEEAEASVEQSACSRG